MTPAWVGSDSTALLTRARVWGTRAIASLLFGVSAGLVAALVSTGAASAHTPHDVIADVELSPDFDQDQTVFTISRMYLLESNDGGTTWRRLVNGLDAKSHLSSVEISRQDADLLYVSTRGDGVYKSTDGGRTFENKSVGLADPENIFTQGSVRSLKVSPHRGDVALATTSDEGSNLFLTTDGAENWVAVPDLVDVTAVAFAPDQEDLIAAGDAAGRVHVSEDGGSTWTATAFDAPEAGRVHAIAVSPNSASDATFFVGTESGGVFKTEDGGASFSSANDGLTDLRVTDLLVPSTFDVDSTVWVVTWEEGTFVSDDAGATWTAANEGLTTDEMAYRLDSPHFTVLNMSNPTDEGEEPTMFVAGFDGLFRSEMFGRIVWQVVDTQVPSNIAGIAVSPDYPNDSTIAVATYVNGALISEDGGETWRAINDGLASEFEWTRRDDYVARLNGIGFYPTYSDDDTLFAGIRGYFLTSTNGGERWEAQSPPGIIVKDEFPPDYFIVAFSPDFAEDETIIMGTDGGKVFRSTDKGENFDEIAEVGVEITVMVPSAEFASDQTIFAATKEGIYRSLDAGETWTQLENFFPREVTGLAMSPDFGTDGTMFAGTPVGLFITRDGGETWTRYSELAGDSRYVETVAVSPAFGSDETVLVSVRGRGLLRSTDGGRTFEPFAPGLIENNVMLSSFYHPTTPPIVFSPGYEEDQTIFGIAEERVYRSTDGGQTWTTIDLPVTTHPTDPVAAPAELLRTPRYEPGLAEGISENAAWYDTPVGNLSNRRVLAAAGLGVVTFLVLLLVPIPVDSKWWRLAIRVGAALVVVAAALFALADERLF